MAEEITTNPRSESRNFFVSIATLIFIVFELLGAPIDMEPGNLVDSILSGNTTGVLTILIINLLNPAMKLIGKLQRGELSASFLGSLNFQTQALTVILTGVAIAGISFPPEAAGEVVNAIDKKDFVSIWIALGVNIINPVVNFIQSKKTPVENPAA